MFTTAVACMAAAITAKHRDVQATIGFGPMVIDLFSWSIIGMYLGVL